MKNTYFFLVFLFTTSCIFFTSCSWFGGDKLYISYKNFNQEIELQQNLEFTFSESLVSESKIGTWIDEALIEFSPKVAGKFKWTAANQLTFSPERGFLPNADYTAKIASKVLAFSEKKYKLEADSEKFQFHTPYLAITQANTFWTLNNSGEPEVKIDLAFNYPVNPINIAKLISVEADKKTATFKLLSAANSHVMQITVPQSSAPEEKPLDIKINKGLTTEGSERVADELIYETVVPSKQFSIVRAVAEYNGEEGYIHVYTNQSVGVEDLQRFIKVQPDANISVEKLEQGFLVKGNFQVGSTYQLTISQTLQGIFKTKLLDNFEQGIVFGDLAPLISFTSKSAIYLTSKGEKNIGLRVIGVPNVVVNIYKIYQNNITHFLNNSSDGYGYYQEDDYYSYYPSPDNYGDLVFSKQMQSSAFKKAEGLNLVNLNFADKNTLTGLYLVEVASTEEQWRRDSRVVAISDIGLIVKNTPDEVLVFANSILSATPIQEAEITLLSTNNQEVYTLKTDKDGVAKFSDVKKKAPGFQIGMVLAKKDADFNYISYKQTAVNTSSFELGGLCDNEAGIMAFLYGDRDLYRPDDVVFLKTILRNKDQKPIANQPVKIKVFLPDGKEFALRKGNTTAQGSFEIDVKLPASTVTGSYWVEVYTGNDILLASKSLSVEEFMPDRIKVLVNFDASQVKIGKEFSFEAQAFNMFGPPAVNKKYTVDLVVNRKAFQPKGLEKYDFEIAGKVKNDFESIFKEGSTDEQGNIKALLTIPKEYENLGMLEAKIYTTVIDENGRPVGKRTVFEVATQEIFFGIQDFGSYVGTRQPIIVPMIAVNEKGQVFNSAKAKVQVVKYEWQSVLEKDYYGSYKYVSQRKERIVQNSDITLSGKASTYQYIPLESGEYELRLFGNQSSAYVAKRFYAYSWGSTAASSFEVEKDGKIAIETDKETYQVGEKATILFKSPFAGKLFVTVERDKVFQHFILDTDKNAASLSLDMKEEYLPNVFISATLIKPITDNAIPLTVAHGYKCLTVDKKDYQIGLKIIAPEQIRSNISQEIIIETDKKQQDIEVTVAVIDEGILQIKNYQTPNIYGYFYQKRALSVKSYDVYPRLFPELKASASNFGADGYDLSKRNNPLANKRVKLLSFWSGTLKTDKNGKVTYKVAIPQFSGEARIMAVAAKDNMYGSAEKAMKIADPLVVSVGLPRFAAPSDELTVPVTVTNTTTQPANTTIKIKTTGALGVIGESNISQNIPAGSEKTVFFAVKAENKIGNADVSVEVNGLGAVFTNVTDMTVRPTTGLLKSAGSGMIVGGRGTTLDLKKDYLQNSVSGKLYISKSPMVEFAKHLNELITYPYGCLEQTISTVFPQLYVAEITESLQQASAKGQAKTAAYNINEAIRKLQTMQLYDGSLAYWQGGTYTSWWGTAYAAHFLTEAQKAGFEVDNRFLERIYTYLQAQSKAKQKEKYYYYDAKNVSKMREIASRDVFYSLYVLALAGQKDLATMNYYKTRTELLTTDSKYLLAATYLLVGEEKSYRTLQPQSFSTEKSVNELAGSFSSYLRDLAISLNVLLETDPDNAQVGVLAKRVSEQLKTQKYNTTQELAFSMLALGKLAKKAVQADVQATIKVNGKEIGKFTGTDLTFNTQVAGNQVDITTTGTGNLYYFWSVEGLNENGAIKEEDVNLTVRKEFYDRKGEKINVANIKQNDLVIVKIALKSTAGDVPNVVVSDMLPACFEIENPRIGNIPEVTWIKNATVAQYVDFRDDRIHFFTTATPQTKDYYYVVRAVSKGKYNAGVLSADAMYNGEYRSYVAGNKVTVE
jgi:uncharacterized protein YfaS (alpha-2-macroglobulin family)